MGLSEIANHTGVTVLFPVSNSVDDVKPRPVMWTTFDVHRGWWGEQPLVVRATVGGAEGKPEVVGDRSECRERRVECHAEE